MTKRELLESESRSSFADIDLSVFRDYNIAYHYLMADIVSRQQRSTALLLKGNPVKRIFVDGGFSKNSIFMHLLAEAFPHMEVYAAAVAQASALGAALAIHPSWTNKPIPSDLISLKYYASRPALS
jgi:L-fuculokinase